MAIERKLPAIAPRLLTADGGTLGQIQLSDTRGIKVKQIIVIAATSLPELQVQVKRVISDTLILVGDPNKPITDRSIDLSQYSVALGAYIYAEEQEKAKLTAEDRLYATYDQEPTVAWRNVLVDELGRYYGTANPLPVQLSNGSVNIGTVNAELEVQLSHKDNYPHPGDIHDSVRVGGPSGYEQEVNADGSINMVPIGSLSPIYAQATDTITTANFEEIFSYTSNNNKTRIRQLEVFISTPSMVKVLLNGVVIRQLMTSPMQRNAIFKFEEPRSVSNGVILSVQAQVERFIHPTFETFVSLEGYLTP